MFKCDKCKNKVKQVWNVNGKWFCIKCKKKNHGKTKP